VTLAFTIVITVNQNLPRTGDCDALTLRVGDITNGTRKTNRTSRLGFHAAGHSGSRGGTTNVECTHCELSAWLTNRLSSDHTDSFTNVNQRAATEVTTIAVCAKTMASFAGQWCTYPNLVNAKLIDEINHIFIKQGTRRNRGFL
jgi:hypothetical protein